MTHLVRLISLAGLCMGISCELAAQRPDDWSVYSALTTTNAVTLDKKGHAWAATTGGVVRYSLDGESPIVYRTDNGLLALNSTAIACDHESGDIYVGSAGGAISVLHADKSWSYSTAISAAASRPDRRINGFGFHGKRVYILTAFGVAVYSPDDSTIRESYLRFASYAPDIGVNDILFWNDAIWLATDRGVVTAPMTGRNLSSPGAWDALAGLEGKRALSLAVADDRLLVGTTNDSNDGGAYALDTDAVFRRRTDLPTNEPVRFARSGDALTAATRYRIHHFLDGVFREHPKTAEADIVSVAGTGERAVIAVVDRGFGLVEADTVRMIQLNSPVGNRFASLALGSEGSVWVAHELRGVSRLIGDGWRCYDTVVRRAVAANTWQTPAIPDSAVAWQLGAGANSSIWIGYYGKRGGFVEIMERGEAFIAHHLDNTNSPLTPVVDNYVIGAAPVADADGHTWFVNWSNVPGASGTLLVVKLRDDEHAQSGRQFESYAVSHDRNYRSITIDDNGTKWLGGPGTVGLTYVNERGTLSSRSDDATPRIFTTADGLLDNSQTALAIDRDGLLWIGSPKGVLAITNPSAIVDDGARPSFHRLRALNDVVVRAIVVDALNQKWIGSDRGVYVVSADGAQVIEHFTEANSPLVSDDVLSLLSVPATGHVYIGTSNGMSRVATTAVQLIDDLRRDLRIEPHPFVLPASDPVRIVGLPANATVKIMSLSGAVVHQFDSPGGAVAYWDGSDGSGDPVPSGIYLVAASDPSGAHTVVAKVAVVRR